MKVPIKRYIDLLGKYMLSHRLLVIGIIFGLFAGIGLQLLNPQFMRYFIDNAIDTSATAPPLKKLTLIAFLILTVAIIRQFLGLMTVYFGQNLAWSSTNSLREDLASHCLNLDMSFHNSRTPGELLQRLDGDVGVLGNFFSTFLVTIAGNILLIIGVLLILFFENVVLGIAFTCLTVISLFCLLIIRRIAVPYNIKFFQAGSELFGFIEERLSGIEDIQSLGAGAYVLRKLFELNRKVFRTARMSAFMGSLIGMSMQKSMQISQVLGLLIGGYLFLKGEITIGTVFMLTMYILHLAGPLQAITTQIGDFQQSGASIARIEELFKIKNKIIDGDGALIPEVPLSVEFKDVNFSYVEGERILKNVSFNLAKGKVLGLLGKTGSGKTTIGRLLFRFYDPDNGDIFLNGQPVKGYMIHDLRSNVGMITQDVELFQSSVRDNLTFFNPDIPDQKILDAIGDLGLTEWYQSLPDGLDTHIGHGMNKFSAGEEQLFAFIRIFLKNPGLIILDEATSRLDLATEQLIEKAIERLCKDKTVIIIAHRLSTVNKADDIIILEKGIIVESGSREALVSESTSRFNNLLKVGLEEIS